MQRYHNAEPNSFHRFPLDLAKLLHGYVLPFSPSPPKRQSPRIGDRLGIPPSFLLGKKHLVRKPAILQRNQNFVVYFFFFSIPYLLGKSNAPPDSVTNKTPRSALRFGAFELNQGTHCNSRLVVWERLQARGHWVGRCGEQVSHRCNARRPMGFLGSVSDTAYTFIRRLFQPNFTAEYTSE